MQSRFIAYVGVFAIVAGLAIQSAFTPQERIVAPAATQLGDTIPGGTQRPSTAGENPAFVADAIARRAGPRCANHGGLSRQMGVTSKNEKWATCIDGSLVEWK